MSIRPPIPHPAANLLAPFAGQWVAISADGSRVVAAAATLRALDQLVQSSGEDPEQVGYQRVEPEDSCLGGGELL
jgi:hypothetical protein